MGTRRHARAILESHGSGHWVGRPGDAKTQVVVRFIGGVPVAVRRTQVLRLVVPATPANHALVSFRRAPVGSLPNPIRRGEGPDCPHGPHAPAMRPRWCARPPDPPAPGHRLARVPAAVCDSGTRCPVVIGLAVARPGSPANSDPAPPVAPASCVDAASGARCAEIPRWHPAIARVGL